MILAVTIVLLIAALLGVLGYFYWSDPEHFRTQLVDSIERSPRVLRVLGSPWLRLYKGKLGLWQMRIMGAGLLFMSAVLLFAAVAALLSRR